MKIYLYSVLLALSPALVAGQDKSNSEKPPSPLKLLFADDFQEYSRNNF